MPTIWPLNHKSHTKKKFYEFVANVLCDNIAMEVQNKYVYIDSVGCGRNTLWLGSRDNNLQVLGFIKDGMFIFMAL